MKIKKIALLNVLTLPLFMLASAHAEQICMSQISATAPESRFTISADGQEVTDNMTDLVWQRCSIGQTWNGSSCEGEAENLTWQQALTKSRALGNGYRLPNFKESLSIVESQCKTPALNTTIFPNMPDPSMSMYTVYWTSTPNVQNDTQVLLFDYNIGSGLMQQPPEMYTKDSIYMGYFNGYARAVRNK